MSKQLFTGSWWKAALIRAIRTAIFIAIPYLGAVYFAQVPWITVGSAALMAFIASLVTSLAGLAEVTGENQPWWYATLGRTAKSFAQGLAAGFGTAVLVTDVQWTTVLQTSALMALGSLLNAVLANLPEASNPQAAATLQALTPGDDHSSAVPVIATVPVTSPTTIVADDAPKHSTEA